MNNQIHIFNRRQVRRQRDRAAPGFAPSHCSLHTAMAEHLLERVDDVKRDFATVLDLGAHDGALAQRLAGTKKNFVVAADLSAAMLKAGTHPQRVVADEECLPFAAESFDLIVSNLSLHWVNDLPGALAQIRQALRPGGLFLAAFLGGQTLFELRSCLWDAELALTGGVSSRVSPSIDMQTASALVQRAGFTLPVTDHEVITLTYSDAHALMHDLRGMGETNAQLQGSRKPSRRALFNEVDRLYRDRFARADGRLPATFEAIFIHGWR